MRAMRGDTVIPNGVKEGEVSVKVFVMNCDEWYQNGRDRGHEKKVYT